MVPAGWGVLETWSWDSATLGPAGGPPGQGAWDPGVGVGVEGGAGHQKNNWGRGGRVVSVWVGR